MLGKSERAGRMPESLVASAVGLALALSLPACRSEPSKPEEAVRVAQEGSAERQDETAAVVAAQTAPPPPPKPAPVPKCETEGYPCTWAEVASEIVERTDDLAREGLGRMADGAAVPEVAGWLASQGDVEAVMTDGRMVRFRLAGGRPVWVTEALPESFDTRGFASPAFAQPPGSGAGGPDDPIGKNPPGRIPWKKALILAPFQWHFGDREVDDLLLHLGLAGEADQDPFAVRDYRCGGDSQCVEIKANDLVQLDPNVMCSAIPGSCPMAYGVDRSDFKGWQNYDLIHVGTHGFYLCGTSDPEEVVQWLTATTSAVGGRDLAGTSAKLVGGGCVVGLATGRVFPEGSVAVGSVTDPGVEYIYAGIGRYCDHAPPGSVRWVQQFCDKPDFLLELVTDDFFVAEYGGALKDKMIFLNACSALADGGIALGLSSGDSVVLGWSDPVPVGTALRVSETFYEAYLRNNLPAVDAWLEAAQSVGANIPVSLEIDQAWRTSLPADLEPAVLESTELESSGTRQRRGREMVSVRWKDSDVEIEDGSTLETRSADDETCEVELGLVLEGVPEEQDPASMPLTLEANGNRVDRQFRATEEAGPYRFRFDGTVPIPKSEARSFDLEISAQLPRGGVSRWRYEDLSTPCGECYFKARLSGDPARTLVEGEAAIWSEPLQDSARIARPLMNMLEALGMQEELVGADSETVDRVLDEMAGTSSFVLKFNEASGEMLSFDLTTQPNEGGLGSGEVGGMLAIDGLGFILNAQLEIHTRDEGWIEGTLSGTGVGATLEGGAGVMTSPTTARPLKVQVDVEFRAGNPARGAFCTIDEGE